MVFGKMKGDESVTLSNDGRKIGELRGIVYPNDLVELMEIISKIKGNEYMVVENNNLNDIDFKSDCVFISLKKMNDLKVSDNCVYVSTGYNLNDLYNKCLDFDLCGIEFISNMEGTVGEAVYNNRLCNNKHFSDVIVDVTYLDSNGSINSLNKDECLFVNGGSIFKDRIDFIILSVKLKLSKNI